jgi:hypothetical protein
MAVLRLTDKELPGAARFQDGVSSFFISVAARVVDPDSVTLWIRIRIGNPDPGSVSRGKKIKKFQCKNALFSYF